MYVLKAGKSKIKVWADWGPGERSLPGLQILPSCCPHMAERGESKVSGVSSCESTNPITRASPSWLHLNLIIPQMPYLQIPFHQGLLLQRMNWCGGETQFKQRQAANTSSLPTMECAHTACALYLLYIIIYQWTLRLLPYRGYCNCALVNRGVHLSFSLVVLFSLDK